MSSYFSIDSIAGDRDEFNALMAGTGPVYQREQRYRCADGRIIWCRMTMSAIRGADAAAPRAD